MEQGGRVPGLRVTLQILGHHCDFPRLQSRSEPSATRYLWYMGSREGELFSITPSIACLVASLSIITCIWIFTWKSLLTTKPFGQKLSWEIFKIVSVNDRWNFSISPKYLCSEEAKMWIFCQLIVRDKECLFKLLQFLLLSFIYSNLCKVCSKVLKFILWSEIHAGYALI